MTVTRTNIKRHLLYFLVSMGIYVALLVPFKQIQLLEGLIVTSNYLATNRDRRRCDRKVTPFFCVRRLILQYWVR